MYLIDIFRIVLDMCRERCAAQAHKSGLSDSFDKALQVIDFRNLDIFAHLLLLIRFDHN